MQPQTINIKCPSCGVVLRVTNSKNEPEKRFSCPKCGKRIVVPFYRLKVEDGETQLDGNPVAQSTQLGDANLQQSCHLICNGVEYPLPIGRNVVGRKASSSSADIQIETLDKFMSREHMIINVRRLPDGGIKVDVSNHKNKNSTRINDLLLQSGDAIVLHDGDKLQAGSTVMTFHIE